jgi:hypothetical protein
MMLSHSSATSTRQRPLAAGHSPDTMANWATYAPKARRQSDVREVIQANLCLALFLGTEPGDRFAQFA